MGNDKENYTKITTIGDLKRDLELFEDDCEIYFEGFEYYRTKLRGEKLVQIELSEKTEY